MVESSAAALSFQGIIVPNPSVERGHRTPLVYSTKRENTLLFATRDNLIFLDTANPLKSKVYVAHHSRITSFAENPKNGSIAFGDEKGQVTKITLKQDGTFVEDKTYPFISGELNQVLWSEDGLRIIGVGAGTDIQANAVTADTGSKSGTILGFTSTQLCSDLGKSDKKNALFTAGEGNEVLVHEGFPFKGQGKSTGPVHSNFVNQIKFSKDFSQIFTVSSDKSIALFDPVEQAVRTKLDGAHEMGIYDGRWLHNGSSCFATCSADNTVKLWDVSNPETIAHKDTFVLHDKPKKTSKQILGMAETPDGGSLACVTLGSDLAFFTDIAAQQGMHPTAWAKRHHSLISDVCNFGSHVAFISESRVYSFDSADEHYSVSHICKVPAKQKILQLQSNNHSLYAISLDKFVMRFTLGDGGRLVLTKSVALESAAGKYFTVSDDAIYVLRSNNEIDELDAFELTVKRTHKLSGDATCIAYSSASKEIWVGDKKGELTVFSTADFSIVHSIKKHTKAISVLTTSADGTHVASGDGYRYQYVWDAASREMKNEYGFLKDKILSMRFSNDGSKIVTTCTDRSFGVIDLTSGNTQVKRNPHEIKQVSSAVIGANGNIYTAGDDCCIRIWKGI